MPQAATSSNFPSTTSWNGTGRRSIVQPKSSAMPMIALVVTLAKMDGDVGTTKIFAPLEERSREMAIKFEVENSSTTVRVFESRWSVIA